MKASSYFVILVPTALCLALIGWGWHRDSGSVHGRAHASSPKSRPVPSRAAQGKKTHAAALSKMAESVRVPELTPAQLAAYVEQKHHGVGSLLTAWQLGHDRKWLDEAAAAFPDNPRVALAEIESHDLPPEERKAWIARLKEHAPENALGWCYAAADDFKEGRTDEAKEALADASLTKVLDAYGKLSARDNADAYRSAGYDATEAEFIGQAFVILPQVALMMDLAKAVATANGDDAESAADMRSLVQMLRKDEPGGPPLISVLVSAAAERRLLDKMSEFDLVPGSDEPVAARLEDLNTEKALIKEVLAQSQPLMATLTDSELRQYLRRSTVEGELKALQWVIQTKRAR